MDPLQLNEPVATHRARSDEMAPRFIPVREDRTAATAAPARAPSYSRSIVTRSSVPVKMNGAWYSGLTGEP